SATLWERWAGLRWLFEHRDEPRGAEKRTRSLIRAIAALEENRLCCGGSSCRQCYRPSRQEAPPYPGQKVHVGHGEEARRREEKERLALAASQEEGHRPALPFTCNLQ